MGARHSEYELTAYISHSDQNRALLKGYFVISTLFLIILGKS